MCVPATSTAYVCLEVSLLPVQVAGGFGPVGWTEGIKRLVEVLFDSSPRWERRVGCVAKYSRDWRNADFPRISGCGSGPSPLYFRICRSTCANLGGGRLLGLATAVLGIY
jgi:hypothetical protein